MWIVAILIGMGLLTAIFLLNFYRDPERRIPKGNNIVSPADGKVISIIDTSKEVIKVKKGFVGKIRVLTKDVAKKCYVVSIFMSPLDVHVNRDLIVLPIVPAGASNSDMMGKKISKDYFAK